MPYPFDPYRPLGLPAPKFAEPIDPFVPVPGLPPPPALPDYSNWTPPQPAAPAQPPSAPSRTWGEAGSDLLVGVGRGSAGLASGLANLADLATFGGVSSLARYAGGALDRALGGPGEGYTLQEGASRIDQAMSGMESDPLRQRRQQLQERIAAAGQQGGLSGGLDKAWEAAKGTATDLPMLGQLAAEQVPILATMGLGTVGTASRAGQAARAAGATEAAIEQAAQRAAIRSNIGFSGAMGAGFSSQQAAQDILTAPQAELEQSPDYRAMRQAGMDDRTARGELARLAGYPAAAIAGPASALAAGITAPLETAVFRGQFQSGIAPVVGAALRETAEEIPQESSEQIGTNVGVRVAGMPRDVWANVPEAAGMAGVAGFLMGGALGGAGNIQARARRAGMADSATRATADLRANLDFAREQDIAEALAGLDTVEAQGKVPKRAAERLAVARQQLTDELALRASPAALDEPMDNARGAAGYLGFADRPHELSDDQIFDLVNRPLPNDAPGEWQEARIKYGIEALRRQDLNEAAAHFEENPEAVAGVAKVLGDIAAGKPLAKGAHGSTDYNLASLSDDELTRYRMAGEVLLRDRSEALGKARASVEKSLELLHQENDRRNSGERRDAQAIREADVAQRVAKGAKGSAKLLDGLSPDALERMAAGLESRVSLEPGLADTARQIRERAQRERLRLFNPQGKDQPGIRPVLAGLNRQPAPQPQTDHSAERARLSELAKIANVESLKRQLGERGQRLSEARQARQDSILEREAQRRAALDAEIAARGQQAEPPAPSGLPAPPSLGVPRGAPTVTAAAIPQPLGQLGRSRLGIGEDRLPVPASPAVNDPAPALPAPPSARAPAWTAPERPALPPFTPLPAPEISPDARTRPVGQSQPVPGAAETAQAQPPVALPARPAGARGARAEGAGAKAGAESEKQPWEMTRYEFADSVERKYIEKRGGRASAKASDNVRHAAYNRHASTVKQAISEGKPVPSEVLAEYPDLASTVRGGQTGRETSPTTAAQPRPESQNAQRSQKGQAEAETAPLLNGQSAAESEKKGNAARNRVSMPSGPDLNLIGPDTPYSDLIATIEKGIDARRKLNDLPDRLRSEAVAFAVSERPSTDSEIKKWLAKERGIIGDVSDYVAKIKKVLPIAKAALADSRANAELSRREEEKRKGRTKPEKAKKLVLWGFKPGTTEVPIKLGEHTKAEQERRNKDGWTTAAYAPGEEPTGLRDQANAKKAPPAESENVKPEPPPSESPASKTPDTAAPEKSPTPVESQRETADKKTDIEPERYGSDYVIAPTGFPNGTWHVIGKDGEIERFGKPPGAWAMFKTPQAAIKKAEAWYARQARSAEKAKRAEPEPPSPEPAATHADPGEKPEPATPAVVERALTGAPGTGKKHQAAVAASIEGVLAQIDGLIAAAPNDKTSSKRVTVDVPHDGKFQVANTKAALKAFRDKVAKSSAFKKSGVKNPAVPGPRKESDSGRIPQTKGLDEVTLSHLEEEGKRGRETHPGKYAGRTQADTDKATAWNLVKLSGDRYVLGDDGKMFTHVEPVPQRPSLVVARLFDARTDKWGRLYRWKIIDPDTGVSLLSDTSKAGALERVKADAVIGKSGRVKFDPSPYSAEQEDRAKRTAREELAAKLGVEPTGAAIQAELKKRMDAETGSEPARQSRPSSTSAQPVTVAQARAQLVEALGERHVAALERAGGLVLHESDPTKTRDAGFVDGEGVIHLIPGNMDRDALSVALHEGMHLAKDDRFAEGDRAKVRLAHAVMRIGGLKNFIGNPGFSDLVQHVYRMAAEGNPVAVEALNKAKLEGKSDPRVDVAEEAVAYLAEYADQRLPLVRRVLAMIRAALYRIGVKINLTPADVRALALSALKARAKAAGRAMPAFREAAAFSRPTSETDAAEQARLWAEFQAVRARFQAKEAMKTPFRRWFGHGTEGVTARDGKPLTLYHGTNSPAFHRWDASRAGQSSTHPTAGLGFFMTADKRSAQRYGTRLLELHAKIDKPYHLTDADLWAIDSVEAATRLRAKLMAKGYDGAVIAAPGSSPYVIVFESKQAKYTGNEEPTDSEDFRYSRPGRPPRMDSPRVAAKVLGDIGELRDALRPGEKAKAKLDPRNWAQGLSDLKSDTRPAWLGLLSQDMLIQLAEKQLPAAEVREFDDASEKMDAQENKVIQAKAFPLAERWQNLMTKDRQQADAMSRLIYMSTWWGVDPRQSAPDGKRAEWIRAKAVHDAMGSEAKKLYGDVLAFYEKQTERLFAELAARIERHALPEPDKLAAKDMLRQEFERMRKEGPYAPLMRFGDLTVWAEPRDKSDKPVFAAFESAAEQRAFADWLKGEGYRPRLGVKMDEIAKRALPQGDFVGKLAGIIDKTAKGPEAQILKDAMYQLFLRSLPEQAIRKHFIHRKFVPGYSSDALRTFATFARRSAKQTARLAHADRMSDALDKMAAAVRSGAVADPVAAGHLVNELDKSYQWAMNPTTATWASRLTHLGFLWHLGASPAHLLLNLSQQAQVTAPWLAGELVGKKGFGAVAGALLKANKDFLAGNPFAAPEKRGPAANAARQKLEAEHGGDLGRALKALEEAGKTDKTQTYSIAGLSEEDNFLWTRPWTRKITQGAAWFFHVAEVINREASAIAAYRLGRDAGMDHEAAYDLARRAINESHFDYSPSQRARFMRGNVAKVLTLFKQYSLNVTWQLGRNVYLAARGASKREKAVARTKLLGMLGMTFVMAGAVGMPFYGEVMWLMTQLLNATRDDDEPEWDADTAFRAVLDRALSPTGEQAVRRGLVNAFLGVDLSSRVKFDDLWWRDADSDLQGKQAAYHALEQGLGPVAGLAVRGFATASDAIDALLSGTSARGATWRALEGAMPKAIKDISKGLRFQTEGATTYEGARILEPGELGSAASVGQLLGFTPASLTEQYAENRAMTNLQRRIQRQRDALLDSYAMAYRQGDEEVMAALREDMAAFGERYPGERITGTTLRQSLEAREQRRKEIERYGGVALDKKLAGMLLEGGR